MTERQRIVSLVPSATETLCALGADVVACTRFCKQPGIETVGGTKNPDIAAIVALRPDHVIVDTEENRSEDADALRTAGVDVVVTSVRSIADAVAVVGRLANAAGVPAPPLQVPAAHPAEPRRRAFVPIWRRPWMTINGSTYGASLLRSIGIDLITAAAATEYPTVEIEDMAGLAPDLVLVPSEPYPFKPHHVAELEAEFPSARVLEVDGEDLFWWGVRTPAAQHRMAAVTAPDAG